MCKLVTHWDLRLGTAVAVCCVLGTGLLVCHLLFPEQQSVAMALVVVGVAVAVSGYVMALSPLIRWGKQRERVKRGLCPTCGYDFTGNVSGVCPECGTRLC